MATQNFINECKNRTNANRLGRFYLETENSVLTEIEGETSQQTYAGKNLNIYPYANRANGSGITFTTNSDGTITLNGQNNGNANSAKWFYSDNDNPLTIEAGDYYMIPPASTDVTFVMYDGTTYSNFGPNTNYHIKFNTQKSIKHFYIQVSKGKTTQFNNLVVYPMLSTTPITQSDYEPYVGGEQSPSPDYPQEIQSKTGEQTIEIDDYTIDVDLGNIELNKIGNYADKIRKSSGKNLFDKNNTTIYSGYFNASGVISGMGIDTHTDKWFYIECEPNTTYTITKPVQSTSSLNRFRLGTYPTEPENGITLNDYWRMTDGGSTTTHTITTGNDAHYLCVYYGKGESNDDNATEVLNGLQIEEGDTATYYEPYGNVWCIEKNTRKTQLAIADMNNSEAYAGWKNVPNLNKDYPNKNSSLVNLGIKYYSNIAIQSNSHPDAVAINTNNGNGTMFFHTGYWGSEYTQTYWKTNYPDLVFEIIYNLETPEVIEITNEELINQLNTAYYEINQTNNLVSMEFKDSCYVNDTIIGSVYTKSADVKLLNLPNNIELVGKTISPEAGVRYSDDSTEYIQFDDYVIESLKDEQTASNTEFTAMNGSTALDKEYVCSLSFENGETHTIGDFYRDICNQLELNPLDATFDNDDIVMTGNPFQSKETCRVVLSEIEKVSCTIANINWKNKSITLTWLSDQIDYEFNTSDYSTLEGSFAQYGPLNTIILGNSQLDGENVVMVDQESVEEYGEHQIMIDASYFLYTEELRSQAIQAIFNKLDGLKYYDIKLTTPYGKPFMKIGSKIRINTNEEQVYDTYVLIHKFTFDGTFKSVIESPALTSEEQTLKNEYKGKSIRERLARTELIVDKTTGDISSITQKVSEVEDEFDNYYTIDQTNTAIQNAQTGWTNTFSEAGGNNIFRNTGLWFQNSGNDAQQNPYEFWEGIVARESEEKAANHNALLLQNATVSQSEIVPNGNYTASFKYKKLIALADVKVVINDIEYELDALEETEFVTGKTDIDGNYITQPLTVNSQQIKIDFISDTDNACEIYDLMVNAGSVKLAYSQNQNETTTDTVNISKGITITSTDTETTFKANSDGIRVYANSDLNNPKTYFTDKGMTTKEIIVEDKAQVTGLLFQQIGDQIWISKL